MNFFSRFIIRRSGFIAFAGFLLAGVGAYYSVQLYKNLRTDIEELLPTTARSVVDLNEVTSRLESTENLAILVFSSFTKDSKRFVIDLAEKLAKVPRDTIASVDYRIDRELAFFQARRALYMELEDLVKIRDFIQDRIQYEKELYNPLNIFRTVDLPEPILDFYSMKRKYEKRVSSYTRFPEGFYASQDETIRILIVNLPGKLSGIESAHSLRRAVDQAIQELGPKNYAPDLDVRFSGGVQNLIEEHASLMADLELSTIVVILLVGAALLIYYRVLSATWALLASLFCGTLWTFGVSFFAVGYLNANSAFLGAIVIGNGINFGIIFLARYLEERRRYRDPFRAVHYAITRTGTATWTAALAAGLAYGSLLLTGFRGFSQFGLIGLIGMLLCWISAYTVLPALLCVIERFSKIRPPAKPQQHPFLDLVCATIARFAKPLWVASVLTTVVSILLLAKLDNRILETDLSKLRDKRSMTEGSAYLSKYVDDVFQRYLSPIVVLPHHRQQASEIALLLKKRQKENPNSHISAVYSIDDFLPRQQEEKIKVLKEIKNLLPQRLLRRLSSEQRAEVQGFLEPLNFQPIGQSDLPSMVKGKFTERDGSIGNLVLVEPPLGKELFDGDRLTEFVEGIRSIADQVSPGTPVVGALPVTSDMFTAIRRDGPRATLFAFLAVVVLVILLFRNIKNVVLCLCALLLGVFWLMGSVLAFDLKINFLNFIALPITFGIGVDYGVNIFQRYRLDGRGSILGVLRHTGGAVALASLTTMIGYSSLLIAGNQAFVSFGTLAVLGEITCILAALVSLPAYLTLKDMRNGKSRYISKPRLLSRWTRFRFWGGILQWPEWWKRLPLRDRVVPLMLIGAYWGALAILGGLRGDHWTTGLVILALSYGGPGPRAILRFLLPLFLTGIIYDSMRFYSDAIRGPIHVAEPYLWEKAWFGIRTPLGLMTPNEWWQLNTHPFLDVITGLAYLIFIPVFLVVAAYFVFFQAPAIRRLSPRVMWSFFWVNMIGYSTYYWYAAAPPWYVSLYGMGPARMDTLPNPAGCIRFDQILGTNFFGEWYGRSADVFGAIPSLHVAYPLISIYFAFKFKAARIFSVFFYALMCFSAVYLNHHYVIDLIWGSVYAILVAISVDLYGTWRERKAQARIAGATLESASSKISAASSSVS